MRCIVPKDFRKMVRATKETKPVMESTQARLSRKYKHSVTKMNAGHGFSKKEL